MIIPSEEPLEQLVPVALQLVSFDPGLRIGGPEISGALSDGVRSGFHQQRVQWITSATPSHCSSLLSWIGGRGNDHLVGAAGSDHLVGGAGNDWLVGGDQADRLMGGPGNDVLNDGSGHGDLDGGPGNDLLIGGPGTDAFMISPDSGNDVILDFRAGPGVFDHLAVMNI
ncbi:hypothetical protein JJB98_12240 [Bradyrhizobium diazoefficiens]|nr:hypothetical protein JJB98_12240 [Bradyrhizobium diazoefficiens]